MNDEIPADDPELRHRLDATRDELLAARPRPDLRIEHLLGGGPPVTGPRSGDEDPTTELPVPAMLDSRRRTGVVAVLVAAAVVLFGALAAAALGSTEDAPVSVAATPDETDTADTDTADTDSAETDTAETDSAETDTAETDSGSDGDGSPPGPIDADEPFAEHRAWVECVAETVRSAFADDAWPGDLDLEAACGEVPLIDGAGLWWHPEDWGLDGEAWLGFDEICEQVTTDDGATLHCHWPPCEDGTDCGEVCEGTGEDADHDRFCLGFDLRFDGTLPDDLDEWFDELPDDLDEWFDELPDDLDEWFDSTLPDDLDEWFDSTLPDDLDEWFDELPDDLDEWRGWWDAHPGGPDGDSDIDDTSEDPQA